MFNPSSSESYVKETDRYIKQSAQRKHNSENIYASLTLNIMLGMTKDLYWCNPSLYKMIRLFIKAPGKQPAGTDSETNDVNNTR